MTVLQIENGQNACVKKQHGHYDSVNVKIQYSQNDCVQNTA